MLNLVSNTTVRYFPCQVKNTLDGVNLVWDYASMANRTFSFTKEDEKLIATIQKKIEALYGKASVIAVVRYALLYTARNSK